MTNHVVQGRTTDVTSVVPAGIRGTLVVTADARRRPATCAPSVGFRLNSWQGGLCSGDRSAACRHYGPATYLGHVQLTDQMYGLWVNRMI